MIAVDLAPSRLLSRLLVSGVALLLAGCGITFSEEFDGTELFRTIRLEGAREVGQELAVTVVVNQAYPVPVRIACYYEDGDKLTDDQLKLAFQERATLVGEEVLDASIRTSPDDDVEDKELTFRFRVEAPGDYFIACLTPSAPENGLGLAFEIEQTASVRRL